MAKRFQLAPQWFALIVAALLIIIYGPTLDGGFLWDDDDNFLGSEVVRQGKGIWRIWTDLRSTQQYYPLTHTSFWLHYQTTGEATWPLRVGNLLLHGVSSGLVWLVLRRLTVPAALFAAAVFALHPLHVESVAWITERKNTLSLPFYLATLLLFLRHHGIGEKHSSASKGAWGKDLSLSLACFLLAVAAKTSLCVLPAILVVCLLWKKGRPARSDLVGLIPFFVLGVGAGLITAWIEVVDIGAHGAFFDYTPLQKLLRGAKIFWFYVLKLVVPTYQSFIYPRWVISISDWRLWGYLFAGLAALGTCFWALRTGRGRGPLVAFLCYGVAIFPALGFANVLFMRWSFVQDHFCYGASIPVIALGCAAASRLLKSQGRQVVGFATGLTLALLTLLSRVHAARFTEYNGLFEHSLQYAPSSWLSNYNLGNRYQIAGRKREAIERYRVVLETYPELRPAQINLATLLMDQGLTEEGLKYAAQAADDPNDPANPLQRQYAVALVSAGAPQEAIRQLEIQLTAHPDWTKGQRLLAWVLATWPSGRHADGERAVKLAEKACAATVNTLPRCLSTLAAAQAQAGRFDQAVDTALRATKLATSKGKADEARSYNRMAALFRQKKPYHIVRKRR